MRDQHRSHNLQSDSLLLHGDEWRIIFAPRDFAFYAVFDAHVLWLGSVVVNHVKPISQLRFDYIRLRYDYDEKLTCSLFARVQPRRVEAGARDTS